MSDLRPGGALTNIAGLEKPINTLIEKISDAVGGIARPWQITRVAEAEAKAEVIRAESRLQISEIEERALQRMIREEGKQQANIESISEQAIAHLTPDAKPENMENDWITHFFDRSRLISDKEMQSMWANLLASEANNPGTISKRTVDLVATLDKTDAQTFTSLCTFAWMIGGITVMIPKVEEKIFEDKNITFFSLNHLDDIGLVTFNSVAGFVRKNLPKKFQIHYYGTPVILELPDGKSDLQAGQVLLTKSGTQLAAISGSQPSAEYFDFTLGKWMDAGIIVSSPLRKTA